MDAETPQDARRGRSQFLRLLARALVASPYLAPVGLPECNVDDAVRTYAEGVPWPAALLAGYAFPAARRGLSEAQFIAQMAEAAIVVRGASAIDAQTTEDDAATVLRMASAYLVLDECMDVASRELRRRQWWPPAWRKKPDLWSEDEANPGARSGEAGGYHIL